MRSVTKTFLRGKSAQKSGSSESFASSLTRDRIGQPLPRTHPHILKEEESVVILPSARYIYMTNDIPYRYKQNVNFLYLSGFHENSSVIVLTKDAQGKTKYFIFCRERVRDKELWDGPVVGVERAGEIFGADAVHSIDNLGKVLEKLNLKQRRVFVNDNECESSIATEIFTSLQGMIENLRVIKSEPEQDIMREGGKISGESFGRTMNETLNMKTENHVNALFEYECARRGCKRPAYPPVVAGGVSATTLHYINNDDILIPGDLILMDAGGEFHDYCSDITRTWPINGKFSDAQKELYNAVLEIQRHCFKYCVPGASRELLYKESVAKTIKVLKELGLNQYANYENFNRVYPHDISHYLGMDLHDTLSVSKTKRFQPGFVVTVEPGLYFADDDSIPERFRNIGIRIEDDVLITSQGHEILSRAAPKTVEEIEAHCANLS